MKLLPPQGAARLIVGASEHNADLLYATKFFVPDPIIWFSKGSKTYALLSPLEIDRARREAKIDHILSLAEYEDVLQKKLGRRPTMAEVACAALRKEKIGSVWVPHDFPVGLADVLREENIEIKVCQTSPFFPERKIKKEKEIQAIAYAQSLGEAGLARGIEVLEQATIKAGYLFWAGKRLTSEILRGEIDSTITRLGGLPARTIVAGGEQACDPHEAGHGPLRAQEMIILDIFPRDQKTGYFGDLTRTVIKGRALEPQRKLYATVEAAQALGLKEMKPGVDGKALHEKIVQFFDDRGFKTEKKKGRWVGFFHGTGHSLGLEIHEPPRFAAGKFEVGHIMTVEPGLYYPGLGGVRLEDLVVLKAGGIRNLTKAPRRLEIA